ncbi:hypothetical protein HQ585_01245 [candidate division KSB1 bacterium]|nr:hypothetical protein [candidate division KSB1 bacterium]
MDRNKIIACRFDKDLYNKINECDLKNSDIIRQAVKQFLNGHGQNAEIDDDDEYYSIVYNDLYNVEMSPLIQENRHLEGKVHGLEDDKVFLMDEVRALTVMSASRIPLLQRIKKRLLSNKEKV